MPDPLLAWTRPLTADERRADIESALREFDITEAFRAMACDRANRDDMVPRRLWCPVLPRDVPQCPICTLPHAKGNAACSACTKLQDRLGRPVDTLEFLAVSRKDQSPENTIWVAKDEVETRGVAPIDWLTNIAAALSAYLEAHCDRLLGDSPLVTAIPSRAPVLAASLQLASSRGWFSVEVQEAGDKVGEWWQHRTKGTAARLARTERDWALQPGLARGRQVLLLDDVFVTGASMFSCAAALKKAGALEVRGLAVARHVHTTHLNYFDALRITQRTQKWEWSPARAAVARL